MKDKNIFLVLTACVVIGGELRLPKTMVEVSRPVARDLLDRKKARLATEDDGAPAAETEQEGQEGDQGSEAGADDTGAPAAQEKAATKRNRK